MSSESPGLVIFAHSDTRTLDGFYGKVWLSSKTKYGRYYGLESGLKNVTFIPVWVLMVWVFGAFALSTASAETEPELKGEALHIALVETALKYDFFNQRCRGVSASQNEAKVNRLFIEKYNLTVNNFIKRFLTDDPRDTESAMKKSLYAEIYKLGGCQEARRKGLESELKKDFRRLYEQVESSPWFPIL